MYRNMRYIFQALQALCLATLVSCVQEGGAEYPDGEGQEEATSMVTIQVGAAGTGQTRAYGGDAAAIPGEFMNTLTLFVVDDQDRVELVIHATDSLGFEPADGEQHGCETNYSTSVRLRNGMKTIYAFANLERHQSVGGTDSDVANSVAAVKEGDVWSQTGLEQAVLDDPASKVDLEYCFIPMTARQAVSLPTGTVYVELVRLVGKVRPVLTNDNGNEVTVTALSIGNFADRVSLFEGANAEGVTRNVARRFTLNHSVSNVSVNLYGEGVLTTVAESSREQAVPEIYVNETAGTDPFTVTLTVDNEEMSGRTSTTAIPRNHYLPLALSLSNFQLEVTAYVSPIGGYPVPITVPASLTDNYEATVPEGSVFEIGGKFVLADGSESGVAAWTWSLPEGQNADGKMVIDGNMTAIPLTGYFTALPEREVTMDFSVTAPRAKNGTLTLTTEPLKDLDDYTVQTRSLRWTDQPARYELVNLGYNNK